MATATGYSYLAGGKAGFAQGNLAGWNTTLTAQNTSAQEVVGTLRNEGANVYMYACMGTNTMTNAGLPLKLTTSIADGDGNVPPLQLTALGATAGGYFSCYAVTIQTTAAGLYAWFLVKGFATLPANSNTGGYTFGTPLAPSSSSAGWAECAAASAIARVLTPLGETLGTATQSAAGGYFCYVNCRCKVI